MAILEICGFGNTTQEVVATWAVWMTEASESLQVRNWFPSCDREYKRTFILISVVQEPLFQGRKVGQQKWVKEWLQGFLALKTPPALQKQNPH